MLQFLHLSDLHLTSRPALNRDALTMLRYIAAHYPTHTLIITGDLTDDGHPQQYAQARAALLPFLGRVFLCPGNHDVARHGNFYSPRRLRNFDRFLAEPLQQRGRFAERRPVWHLVEHGADRALLIALNSNRAARLPLRFACGEIGKHQRIALEKLLADPYIAEVTVMVLFHHHLLDQADPFNTLLDAQDVLNILAGRVQMVLFGHRHQAGIWVNYAGIPYVLACDNSPGKPFAREITLDRRTIAITYRPISDLPVTLPKT